MNDEKKNLEPDEAIAKSDLSNELFVNIDYIKELNKTLETLISYYREKQQIGCAESGISNIEDLEKMISKIASILTYYYTLVDTVRVKPVGK